MRVLATGLYTVAVLFSQGSLAAVSDSEIMKMQAAIAAMAQRLDALEAENLRLRQSRDSVPAIPAVANMSKQSSESWSDRIALKGDFRYRYEGIDLDEAATRKRHRIRARAALVARLPQMEIGLGVASGGADPLSTNQTLGDGGSSKGLQLNLAYATWRPGDAAYLTFGKFKNPLYMPQGSGLIWDGDLRPEGVAAGWEHRRMFFSVMGNFLESDTKGDNDALAWSVQAGTRLALGDVGMLSAALTYHDFPTAGKSAFFDAVFGGNSTAGGAYLFDYQLLELGADLVLSAMGQPLSVYANYVQNQDASANDQGYIVGTRLGKIKKAGSWQLGYQYQDLEADAVLGLLTDSDFANGGTDGKGHKLSGGYAFANHWSLAVTWFVSNETGEFNRAATGGALDYDRIMVDAAFKY